MREMWKRGGHRKWRMRLGKVTDPVEKRVEGGRLRKKVKVKKEREEGGEKR